MLVFQVFKVEFCLQSQATFPKRIFQPTIITLYRTWQCRITARIFYLKWLNDTKSSNVVQYVLDLCTVNVTVITSFVFPTITQTIDRHEHVVQPFTFQFTGVATFFCAVSCRESITRSSSSKFLPVVAG